MNSYRLVATLAVLVLVLISTVYVMYGYTEEATRINIRLTARISGLLFCSAFAASSYQYIFKGFIGFWLISNRKYLGISFALIHLMHLVVLIILQLSFHPVFERAAISSLVGGGLAYFFAVIMLFTSFEQFRTSLSPNLWKGIHTIGGYWIWFIFIKSYWKRAMTEWEYIPLVVLFIAVLLMRMFKLLKMNHKKTQEYYFNS